MTIRSLFLLLILAACTGYPAAHTNDGTAREASVGAFCEDDSMCDAGEYCNIYAPCVGEAGTCSVCAAKDTGAGPPYGACPSGFAGSTTPCADGYHCGQCPWGSDFCPDAAPGDWIPYACELSSDYCAANEDQGMPPQCEGFCASTYACCQTPAPPECQ